MPRNVLIFLACFFLGIGAVFIVRAALHRPYDEAPAPVAAPPATAAPTAPATPAAAAAPDAKPVNTICPICGMPVKPEFGSAVYRGKVIGFGCKMCLPKFTAEPDTYGPAALENRVVP
jgi:YHS domain-containing protein